MASRSQEESPMLRKSLFSFRFEDAAVEAAWRQARLPQFKRHNAMAALHRKKSFWTLSAEIYTHTYRTKRTNLRDIKKLES